MYSFVFGLCLGLLMLLEGLYILRRLDKRLDPWTDFHPVVRWAVDRYPPRQVRFMAWTLIGFAPLMFLAGCFNAIRSLV